MREDEKNVPAVMNDGGDIIGDGLDDYGDDLDSGIIKGRKVKFTLDFRWECGDEVISPDREFLVIEVLKDLQKWVPESRGPVETQVLAADEKFPDVDAMNAKAPRKEWSEKFGQKKGPWQKAKVVYLLDQQTMGIFTYVADTVGGFRPVRELQQSSRLARKVQGPAVHPVVTLGDEFMATQFGGRQRPDFKIKRFVVIGGDGQEPRRLERVKQEPKELNDPLPENMGGEKKKGRQSNAPLR